jgi:hypothetical protein
MSSENLFAQANSEGHHYLLLREISDHKHDDTAVTKEDGWITARSGRKFRKKTTRGWSLLVKWKEGSSDWVPLKDLKESYPVELAEYAKANKIDDEPAFAWWVNDVLRKRNRIISKVKSRYWKTTHKFGIRLPHSVQEALKIDEENGNTFWRDAIEKEMGKIRGLGTFERYDGATAEELRSGKKKLPGYQELTCHMVFDIKMDGKFTRKARYIADGHKTINVPNEFTYSSVVSRESVRIAFLYASLNDLNILSCDIVNAYLNAPCREKLWIEGGPEFGSEDKCVFIVKKAVYGLKTSGASWRQTISQVLQDLGWQSTVADPNVYRRAAVKPNGDQYYELLLIYVDDILVVSANPGEAMSAINKLYDFKDPPAEPEHYLGANVHKWQLPDGRLVWAMQPKEYVKNACNVVKGMLAKDGQSLRTGKGTERPMPKSYRPEVDVSPILDTDLASRYSQLIGMLRWAVELGRIDIHLEVSLLSSHLCLP